MLWRNFLNFYDLMRAAVIQRTNRSVRRNVIGGAHRWRRGADRRGDLHRARHSTGKNRLFAGSDAVALVFPRACAKRTLASWCGQGQRSRQRSGRPRFQRYGISHRLAPPTIICCSPHNLSLSIAGISSRPSGVSEYSTFGGIPRYAFRLTSLSFSISFRAWVSIFGETPSTSRLNSPYRCVPSFKNHKIRPLYLPPIR
jgi:hypothetical protein